MSSKNVGIEEARKVLGDLVTAVQQGTDIILTRNRRPVARITRYQEEPMITIADLTTALGMPAAAQEKVARFAGAFRVASDYTKIGRIAPRWAGQGLAATFTLDEAEELEAEWRRAATDAERLAYLSSGDAVAEEIAERYRP